MSTANAPLQASGTSLPAQGKTRRLLTASLLVVFAYAFVVSCRFFPSYQCISSAYNVTPSDTETFAILATSMGLPSWTMSSLGYSVCSASYNYWTKEISTHLDGTYYRIATTILDVLRAIDASPLCYTVYVIVFLITCAGYFGLFTEERNDSRSLVKNFLRAGISLLCLGTQGLPFRHILPITALLRLEGHVAMVFALVTPGRYMVPFLCLGAVAHWLYAYHEQPVGSNGRFFARFLDLVAGFSTAYLWHYCLAHLGSSVRFFVCGVLLLINILVHFYRAYKTQVQLTQKIGPYSVQTRTNLLAANIPKAGESAQSQQKAAVPPPVQFVSGGVQYSGPPIPPDNPGATLLGKMSGPAKKAFVDSKTTPPRIVGAAPKGSKGRDPSAYAKPPPATKKGKVKDLADFAWKKTKETLLGEEPVFTLSTFGSCVNLELKDHNGVYQHCGCGVIVAGKLVTVAHILEMNGVRIVPGNELPDWRVTQYGPNKEWIYHAIELRIVRTDAPAYNSEDNTVTLSFGENTIVEPGYARRPKSAKILDEAQLTLHQVGAIATTFPFPSFRALVIDWEDCSHNADTQPGISGAGIWSTTGKLIGLHCSGSSTKNFFLVPNPDCAKDVGDLKAAIKAAEKEEIIRKALEELAAMKQKNEELEQRVKKTEEALVYQLDVEDISMPEWTVPKAVISGYVDTYEDLSDTIRERLKAFQKQIATAQKQAGFEGKSGKGRRKRWKKMRSAFTEAEYKRLLENLRKNDFEPTVGMLRYMAANKMADYIISEKDELDYAKAYLVDSKAQDMWEEKGDDNYLDDKLDNRMDDDLDYYDRSIYQDMIDSDYNYDTTSEKDYEAVKPSTTDSQKAKNGKRGHASAPPATSSGSQDSLQSPGPVNQNLPSSGKAKKPQDQKTTSTQPESSGNSTKWKHHTKKEKEKEKHKERQNIRREANQFLAD